MVREQGERRVVSGLSLSMCMSHKTAFEQTF